MSYPYSLLITEVTGNVLSASDYNNEHQNHINNNIPSSIDDLSSNVSAMQATTDPGESGTESLATALDGELQRFRFAMTEAKGTTYWYQTPPASLTSLNTSLNAFMAVPRRPNLTWISISLVDVEANTGTANQTGICFPDGNYRTVTEDTSSTNKYRRFDITATANFTSGTEDSGLRSGISESGDTWYAIYAVKSVINSANFVLAGDTTLPLVANVSTLNSRYGTNGWVYLGMIRNGSDGGTTTDIVKFTMSGNVTYFIGSNNGGSPGIVTNGLRFADTGGATTLTYTYAAGTGNAQIPDHITFALYINEWGATATSKIEQDSSGTRTYSQGDAINGVVLRQSWRPASEGVKLSNGGGASISYDISLGGFVDGILGPGFSPLV